MGGDGGGGVGQIAGGGAAHRGETQFAGAGERHRHHPVLEGERRHVDAVVLDVKLFESQALGQPVGAQQRREAGADINRIPFNRQELAVTPDRNRAGFDRGAADPGADRLIVVNDFQWAEADVFADVPGCGFIALAAFLAAQAREGGAGQGGSHGSNQGCYADYQR